MSLRNEATEEDAEEVIEIMKTSMLDTFSDDIGTLDISRAVHGSGMSKGSAKKKLVAAMEQYANSTGNKLFSVDLIKQFAMEVGLATPKFRDVLDSLNNQGYLVKKGPDLYKLQLSE